MDAQLRAKWIEALRSGEYAQTFGVFENSPAYRFFRPDEPRGFCCLGVLCRVAGEPTFDDEGSNWQFVRENLADSHKGTLVGMNDCEGKTFSEIADFIEKNIPASEVSDDR